MKFEALQIRLEQLRGKVDDLKFTNYLNGYKITYKENGEATAEVWQ